jgi:hypothetical protein
MRERAAMALRTSDAGASSLSTASPILLQENEAELAILHLLVVLHQFEVAFDIQGWPAHRQSSALKQPLDTRDVLLASIQPSCAESSAAIIVPPRWPLRAATRHSRPGFNRMPEGVAEVEQGSLALSRSSATTTSALFRHERQIASASTAGSRDSRRSRLTSSHSKKGKSLISPYLITSARPRPQLAIGQRIQGIGISQHELRLVEGADHVLAKRVIDRRLPTNRRIDLREQVVGTWMKGMPR